MKIFITGIRGFVGSHLAQSLQEIGHDVRGIDNLMHPAFKPVHFNYGDVRYPADIEKFVEWSDVVVHLAAQIHVDKSIENPQETIDINIGGTLNVLEACRRYGKRLVFASTSEVYGTSKRSIMDEDHPTDAQSPYGASKLGADRLCKAYHDTYGLDVRILRNFNIFGPYQNAGSYGAVISIFTKAALEGKPLNIFGDGEQERDYMYIDDALKAYNIVMFTDDLNGVVLNCGSGKTVTINEVAKSIIKITASKSDIVHISARPGEVRRLCAGVGLIKKYGFSPSTDFYKDLSNYIKWYEELGDWSRSSWERLSRSII